MTPQERADIEAELSQLQELQRLQKIDQARQRGQSEYDNAYAIEEGDNILERTGKMAMQPIQQLAYGVARPFQEMGFGFLDLFGDGISEEDKLRVEEIAGKEGLLASTGEVLGEAGTFAIPGAKLSQFMSKISAQAPQLVAKYATKLMPLLADLGLTSGAEFLKAPTEGRSRSERAEQAAKGYLGTVAGLKGLTKTMQKLRPTPSAKRLLNEGVPLTPGQASGSSFVRGSEEALASLPFVSQAVEGMQGNSVRGWNKSLLNQANPLANKEISEVGADGFKQLKGAFKESYDDAYKKINPDNIDFKQIEGEFNNTVQNIESLVPNHLIGQTKFILNNAKNELKRYKNSGDPLALANVDRILRKAKIDDMSTMDVFKGMRKQVRDGIGEGSERLQDVNRKYAKYSILKDAATGTKDPLQNDLIISPANLTGALKKSASSEQLSQGDAFFQQEAQDAINTMSKTRPGNNTLRRSISGAGVGGALVVDPVSTGTSLLGSRLLTTEPVRKALTGGMSKIDEGFALADALRKSSASKKGLRKHLTPEEINNLLRRTGGFAGGATDSEGYPLDED